VSDTVSLMKREQPRVPAEVMEAVRMICGAFSERPNEYVTRVLREAIARDTPRAAKILANRVRQQERGGQDSD